MIIIYDPPAGQTLSQKKTAPDKANSETLNLRPSFLILRLLRKNKLKRDKLE